MNKKAMELSMNVIVIAAIALLILAIMIYLVGGSFKNLEKGTACAQKQGRCIEQSKISQSEETCKEIGENLCAEGYKCCAIVPQ